MESGDTATLFLALWPDDRTRAALAQRRDAWAWDADALPVRAERLHLTLHFLGGVLLRRLPELVDGLPVPDGQFTLRLGRQERWPNGVAVLTPVAVPKALLEWHVILRDKLERQDLRTESRSYRPHVTLARKVNELVVPPTVIARALAR